MADIFISYAREDRERAEAVAALAERHGLTVWWDRRLKGGAAFHQEIERELVAARKVVVLWSAASITSVWVRDEADLARQHDKLLPISLDDSPLPIGFRSYHTLRYGDVMADAASFLADCGLTPQAPATKGADGQDLNAMFDSFFGKKSAEASTAAEIGLEITLAEAHSGKTADMTVPLRSLCRTCNGRGASKPEQLTCQTCAGTGRIVDKQGFFNIEKACPTCFGNGKLPPRSQTCEDCQGNGVRMVKRTFKVNIPKGIESGTRIRLAGEGEHDPATGVTGDLFIRVSVAPDPVFTRDGADLLRRVSVSRELAEHGGEVDIVTLTGDSLRMKLPAGTTDGKQFRVRGRGMPKLRSEEIGDLYVEIALS